MAPPGRSRTGIGKFRGELEEFIRSGRNPALAVTPLQEAVAHGRAPGASNTPMPTPPALTGGGDGPGRPDPLILRVESERE